MATVRVELTSCDNRRVVAGYEYDDQTDLLTSVWCKNASDRPLLLVIEDFPDDGQATTLFLLDETVDMSSLGVKVRREILKDDEIPEREVVRLPFDMQTAWPAA